jgi:threonine/homoserine/homoserine lactone efflux protein
MSMTNGKTMGLRKGILFNLGNYLGHFIVMLACLTLSKVLYTVLPQIQFPMKILGALYVAYLIAKTLFPVKGREISDNTHRSFMVGLVLQLINVKVILFGLTVMSSYLLPYYTSVPLLILFALLMSSIQCTGNIAWTAFGSLIQNIFLKHTIIVNIIMAMVLVYCMVTLFI